MRNVTENNSKVLVANRGNCYQSLQGLYGAQFTYSSHLFKEDSGSYHRYKADEAYLVGEGKKPIDAYLDIEGIIEIAKRNDVDAIHPGYGFLSENIHFARRCEEEGIQFIGPTSQHLDMFGDKVKAREEAKKLEFQSFQEVTDQLIRSKKSKNSVKNTVTRLLLKLH